MALPWHTREAIEIDEKNIDEMNHMGVIAVADHNMKENTNLEFDSVVQATLERAFGSFYHLEIKVKGGDQEEEIITKVVRKGVAREAYKITKKIKPSSPFPPDDDPHHVLLANVAVEAINGEEDKDFPCYSASFRFLEVEFNKKKDVGAGFCKFISYKIQVYLPSRTEPFYFPEEEEEVSREVSILETTWLQTIDDSKASTYNTGYAKVLGEPPHRQRPTYKRRSYKRRTCLPTGRTKKKICNKMDRTSPRIETLAWVILTNRNVTQQQTLEFVDVVYASIHGRFYTLTIQAKDQGLLKRFKTKVWMKPSFDQFCATPLKEEGEKEGEGRRVRRVPGSEIVRLRRSSRVASSSGVHLRPESRAIQYFSG